MDINNIIIQWGNTGDIYDTRSSGYFTIILPIAFKEANWITVLSSKQTTTIGNGHIGLAAANDNTITTLYLYFSALNNIKLYYISIGY